jgi:N-acetylglucosaminyl-diphospho-decaprenol L-rhamnosyltransferase
MSQKHNVTAVIVLYNVTNIVFQCLENLKNIDIIIADNGDNDLDVIKKIKKQKNVIKYFKFKKNIGFGRACNFSIKYAKTDYCLLIEPDVFIKHEDIIGLKDSFSKYPNAGITVPTLKNASDKIIDKLDNIPELHQLEKNNKSDNHFFGDVCVNFCWAAVMMLNLKVINNVGLFNKKIFIFWEDFYLCRNLKKNKIPVIKVFNSRAIHLEGKSTKRNLKSNFIIYKHHILSSFIYFHVKKNEKFLIKRFFIYIFRTFSYLFILRFDKSFKNFARSCAIYSFLKK